MGSTWRNSPLGRGIVGLINALSLETLNAGEIQVGVVGGLGQHADKERKPALVLSRSQGCQPHSRAGVTNKFSLADAACSTRDHLKCVHPWPLQDCVKVYRPKFGPAGADKEVQGRAFNIFR